MLIMNTRNRDAKQHCDIADNRGKRIVVMRRDRAQGARLQNLQQCKHAKESQQRPAKRHDGRRHVGNQIRDALRDGAFEVDGAGNGVVDIRRQTG